MTTKVILDCDTGCDDTLAILYAALHPEIELLAIGAVWGNVPVATAAVNSAHTVAMVGRSDIPVASGTAGPLLRGPENFGYHVHGIDGQGNVGDPSFVATLVEESAADQIIRLALEHPGEIELIAVGPFTNLAVALALRPDLPSLLRGVTIMGGAALAPGNRTPVAEANIIHDPEAAAAVFAAPWRLRMVGLDVTMRTLMTEAQRQQLLDGGTISAYAGRVMRFYMDYFTENAFSERLSCIHDVLAVAIGVGTLIPTLAPTVNAWVDTGNGPGRGQTICDLRGRYMGFPDQEGAHCQVVLESDPLFAQAVVDLLVAAGDSAIPLGAAA
ncbi:nucleoside hydrolase [Glaciihabitans sp. UYNi722]|uniref:nucleoside hydrolase n=1 Tax=Glaciihabitans sp. UYNi722 TaxID=3156344 RepID=UPI0033920599